MSSVEDKKKRLIAFNDAFNLFAKASDNAKDTLLQCKIDDSQVSAICMFYMLQTQYISQNIVDECIKDGKQKGD
ncbi:hypothetical protein HDR60_03300 [bacterium]|nr:hypothetical protein [bacterium]